MEDDLAFVSNVIKATFGMGQCYGKYIKILEFSVVIFLEFYTAFVIYCLVKEYGIQRSIKYIILPAMLHCLYVAPILIGTFSGQMYATIKIIEQCLKTQKPVLVNSESDRLKVNVIFFVNVVLSLTCMLLYTPSLFDDADFYMFDWSVKKFERYRILVIALSELSLLLSAYCIVCFLTYLIYFVFHTKRQCTILAKYAEQDLEGILADINSYKNVDYQVLIYKNLVSFTKHHVYLQRIFHTFYNSAGIFILAAGLLVTLNIFGTLLYIISGVKSEANGRIYFSIFVFIFNTYLLIICGQTLTDESEKINCILYDCPWYYWNTKNKKALLFILQNTVRPFELKCTGMWSLNYRFLLMIVKTAYSLVAVVRNLHI